MLRIKIEKWSPAAETRAVRETGDATAGAPYQVAYMGNILTVTRRCATELYKRGAITGVTAVLGSGGANANVRRDLLRQQLQNGATFTVTVRPSGKAGTFMVHCPTMKYEAPSRNPARTIMLLANEWWAILDHGDGSFDAEVAGCWRLETPTEP